MQPRVTMSGLGRVEKCPTSAVLPQVRSAPSKWVGAGQVRHAFLKNVPKMGKEAALALAPEEHREYLALLNLDRLPVDPTEYAAEVAYALNWRTGAARELGRDLERDYSDVGPDELAGTCDVEGVTDDSVVLLDFKGAHARLPLASDSMQMLALAVSAARIRQRDRAFVGHIRLGEDGEPKYQVGELGVMKLDAAEVRIRETMERVEAMALLKASGAQVQVVEGDHCEGCPAFTSCPAKMSLARAMAYGETVEKSFDVEGWIELRPGDLTRVYERLVAIDAVSARVWKALKEYAKHDPIPLKDGRFFQQVQVETESIDPAAGGRVLAALFGPEVADMATEIPPQKMTWAAVDRALRKHVLPVKKDGEPPPKITHLNKKAEDALREAGALRTSSHPEYKAVRPKALKK